MSTYSEPLCKIGYKLVKSRCKCKQTLKKTVRLVHYKTKKVKKVKKKTKKKYKYDDAWATTRPMRYTSRMPSKKQLRVRRRRIDEVYELHETMKKFKKDEISPDEWAYPPQYCYSQQLLDVIKHMKRDLKPYLKGNI